MKINSEPTSNPRRTGELGASQSLLLGILAALVALFAYLYFFTGVIKEREVQQGVLPSPIQKVKQSIPPRPGSEESRPAASLPQQGQKSTPGGGAPSQSKPQSSPPAPAVAKEPVVPSKPAAEQPKPKPQLPQQVAARQPNTQLAKPPVKAGGSDIKALKNTASQPVLTKTAPESSYSIVVSGISRDKAAAVLAEMKKRGLRKIEKTEKSEEKTMKRLFVDEFSDSQSAHSELEKTRKFSPGSFLVLESSGKYGLYAGSYDQESRAEVEVKRLSGQGMKVTIKKSKVRIPAIRISALATDKEQAEESVRRLKKLGVASDLKQVGR